MDTKRIETDSDVTDTLDRAVDRSRDEHHVRRLGFVAGRLPHNGREYLMKTGKVALSATALLLIFGRYAFSMSCNATSPSTQDCAVGLTWQDNSSGSNQEDCVDIYFSAGPTAFSKVGTVASDVVSFVHNVAGVAAGVQLCYQVQAGNNAGLSLL